MEAVPFSQHTGSLVHCISPPRTAVSLDSLSPTSPSLSSLYLSLYQWLSHCKCLLPLISLLSPWMSLGLFIYLQFFLLYLFLSLHAGVLWFQRAGSYPAAVMLRLLIVVADPGGARALEHVAFIVAACGIWLPEQGSNLGPLHWE